MSLPECSPSAENTDCTPDLVVTTDDGIELALLRKGRQILRVFTECIETLFCVLAVDVPVTTELVDGSLESSLSETGFLQNRLYRRVFDNCGKEVVLRNVRIVHGFAKVFGFAEDLECGATESNLIGWWGLRWKTDDDLLESPLNEVLLGQ